MLRRRMSESNKQTEKITIRCTPELKKRIESKAKQFGQRPSEFVRDQAEAGLQRKTKWDRKKVAALVENQENLNRMFESLNSNQNDLKEKLIEYSEGELALWEH